MSSYAVFPQLDDDVHLARELVGSKAANLSLLTTRGFRVPPGFVVTTAMFHHLGVHLDSALEESAGMTGSGPFAVRSSALAEDLLDASYAGMYETYLNVERADLAKAIRHGFAAAVSERVDAYSATRELRATAGGSPSEMAMLVQQMIDPVAAGVAFTANPLTGRLDETIVTAVSGLAESLVSGDAIGEQWIVHDGKAQCTRAAEGGLDERQAVEVADLARRVEEQFGVPQDIEWAIDDRQILYLLQARPMTAVPDQVEWAPPGPGLWSRNFRLGEWIPEAMTPLFADWILPELESGFLDGMKADVGVVVPFRHAVVNGWYYNALPIPSLRILWRLLTEGRRHALRFLYNALIRVSHNPAAAHRAVLSDLETQWRENILPAQRSLIANGGLDLQKASPQQVMRLVDDVCHHTGLYLWSLAIVGGSAWKMEGVLAKFWKKNLAESFKDTAYESIGQQTLLRGLQGAEPTLSAHAVYSLDWYHPTAGEAELLIGTSSRPTPIESRRSAVLARARRDCEEACRVALRNRPRLLARFNELITVAQHYAVLREQQARDLSLGWPLLRQCAKRLGQLLIQENVIDNADDVFFLTFQEVLDPSVIHTESAQIRRSAWNRQRRLSPPLTIGSPLPLIGDPIALAVEAARTTQDLPEGALVGHPASAGRATGRVRVILRPEDFEDFREGEILVAKVTAPAWTPLFARAAAVVTDGGTLAAHASLVAREYGLPAVVGTGNATERLHTGQLVSVDGGAGIVLPVEGFAPRSSAD